MSIRQITPEMRARILTSSDFAAAAGNQALAREYDACIIGSGPGGAVAAATLAQAGWKVILIERGPFFPAESSSFRVLDMSNRMGHLELTSGLRTALYQGKGLGGGSLIYGAVAMKPQDFIFDEWSRLSGVASINGESLEPHYKHIAEVMSVTKQAITQENKSNSIVRQMAAALGQSDGLETVSRYTQGCAGAGLCNLGCGFNLKGTMANSFIPLGLETGNLTILTECEAHGFEGTRSTTDSIWQTSGRWHCAHR